MHDTNFTLFFPFVCVCMSYWGNIPSEGFPISFHCHLLPPFSFCLSSLYVLFLSSPVVFEIIT
jgi:hypothetical protein